MKKTAAIVGGALAGIAAVVALIKNAQTIVPATRALARGGSSCSR